MFPLIRESPRKKNSLAALLELLFKLAADRRKRQAAKATGFDRRRRARPRFSQSCPFHAGDRLLKRIAGGEAAGRIGQTVTEA
jgi:hypothetical protein